VRHDQSRPIAVTEITCQKRKAPPGFGEKASSANPARCPAVTAPTLLTEPQGGDNVRTYGLRSVQPLLGRRREDEAQLHKAEFERDRKRGIHLVREEVKALQEAATHAENAHRSAMERWQTHWATYDD
jgi:hypothetical protein